jgi:hypothetical protein
MLRVKETITAAMLTLAAQAMLRRRSHTRSKNRHALFTVGTVAFLSSSSYLY